jgi:hypothetical protein
MLVLINAIWHHPKIGYDAVDNLTYIQVLWHRLPKPSDTGEFFSPPLPFALPSIFDRLCVNAHQDDLEQFTDFQTSWICRTYDGKFAQALNVFLSIGSTLLLLGICQRLNPDDRLFRFSALMVLANLTVYYKTFSQVRGEPYVVFFTVLTVYLGYELLRCKSHAGRAVWATGTSLGCLILSRQWGWFLYPALMLVSVAIWARDRQCGLSIGRRSAASIMLSLLLGGFFYLHLYEDYGSFSSFNIRSPIYPTAQQVYGLLRPTHLGGFELFRRPVRPEFSGSILPVLYSETWGDYWGYFTYIKPNSSYGANRYQTSPTFISYLGRVNLVAVLPTLLLAAAVAFSGIRIVDFFRRGAPDAAYDVFVYLAALCMLAGFSWFIYSYVMASDRVLKTTYMIHVLVLLIFPAAALMKKLWAIQPAAYFVLLGLLGAVFVHNVPAMVTHYNVFYFW